MAAEALAGDEPLSDELVREAFAGVTSPGRLEVVRRGPTILLDAAHNPHGAAAAVEAIRDSFTFDPLVGVVGVMADKDVEGLLSELEPVLSEIVCTQNSTPRSMPAEELAEVARDLFGEHRVRVAPRLDDAIEQAVTLAETGGSLGESIGSGGVLVTGSVVTVGEARTLLRRGGETAREVDPALHVRRACSGSRPSCCSCVAVMLPVVTDVEPRRPASRSASGSRSPCVVGAGLMRRPVGPLPRLGGAGRCRSRSASWSR